MSVLCQLFITLLELIDLGCRYYIDASIRERIISRGAFVRRNPEVVSSINSPRPLYDLDLS